MRVKKFPINLIPTYIYEWRGMCGYIPQNAERRRKKVAKGE